MKTIRILGLAVAAAAMVLLVPTSDASAQPMGGARYAGEISGCAQSPCGSVHFTVSEDRSLVQGFTASDVPGDDCQYTGPQLFPFDLDIVDDSFGPSGWPPFEVSGSFPSEGSAQGTLRLAMGDPVCDTGVLDWTATIVLAPVGGVAELPDVTESAARNYVALAGLAAAALAALATGAWYAVRRRLR
jgi:hypothetical protein